MTAKSTLQRFLFVVTLLAASASLRAQPGRLDFEGLMRDVQARYCAATGNVFSWPDCCYCSSNCTAPAYPPAGFYGEYIGPQCAARLTAAIVQALNGAVNGTNKFLKNCNFEGTDIDLSNPSTFFQSQDLGFYSGMPVNATTYPAVLDMSRAAVSKLNCVLATTSYAELQDKFGEETATNYPNCPDARAEALSLAQTEWTAANWGSNAFQISRTECFGTTYDPGTQRWAATVGLMNERGKVQMVLTAPCSRVTGTAVLYLKVGFPIDGFSNAPSPVTADWKWHNYASAGVPNSTPYSTPLLGGDMAELTIQCGEGCRAGGGWGIPGADLNNPCACRQRGWFTAGHVGVITLTFNTTPDSASPCTIDEELPPWIIVDPDESEGDLSDEEKDCAVGGGGPGGGGGGPGGAPGGPKPNSESGSNPGGRNGGGPGGSGKDPEWKNPVELATGEKIEREVDLAVALPSSTFVVNRAYCSDPNLSTGNGICGPRWSMSVFTRLQVGQNDIRMVGASLQKAVVLIPQSGGLWRANGAARQELSQTTTSINSVSYDVYRLTQPGGWHMDFHRTTNHLNGLLLQEVDVYGNKQTYKYRSFDELNNDPHQTPRLESIFLNGEDEEDCLAQVVLDWNMPALPEELQVPTTTLGKLHSMHAYRFDAQRQRTLLKQVFYQYKEGSDDFLGTAGDLIQVVSRERVDQSPELPFRTRVTQYRYHNGTTPSSGNQRIDLTGGYHQLKHVIRPEQIEYLAQKLYPSGYTPDAVAATANTLLGTADTSSFISGTIQFIDLPSKIVGYNSGKVSVQYIQTACGCSGGSQGTKEVFTYFRSGDDASTKVVESIWDGSAFDAYRNHYCDMKFYSGVPYLVNYAIEDDNDTSKLWVWHYEYNSSTRSLDAMMMPSTLDSYTPASSSAASYTPETSTGLVYRWTYTTDHRLKETHLAEGDRTFPSQFTLLSKTTYPGSSPGTHERMWLPTQTEIYTIAGSTADDTVEKTTFTYRFHSDDKIAWIKSSVERELDAENGPGTGTYDSYEFFNVNGQNTWSAASDYTLTKREFHAYSGVVTSITRNASNSTLGTWPDLSTGSWGRSSDGGSLTTTYDHDALGRVRCRTSPGGVKSYTLRTLQEDSERQGIAYFAVVSLPHNLTGTSEFDGPGSITWFNAGDRSTRSSDYTIDAASAYAPLTLTYTTDDEIARSTTQHHLSGLVQSRKEWYSVASSTAYYLSQFEYDALGRLNIAKSPIEGSQTPTISRNSYDVRDRVVKVEVGTDTNPSTGDMVTVAEYFFDGSGSAAQGVGDGYLTFVRQHTGESGTVPLASLYRDTKRTFDFRGRAQVVERSMSPHEYIEYDNLDRVIKRGLYSSVPSGIGGTSDTTRGLYVESKFSQRGLSYKQRVAIDSTNLASGFLDANSWFDSEGRTVGEWSPNAPGIKRQFDAHGRTTRAYVTDRGGDDAPGSSGNYADVVNGLISDITSDTIIEQTDYTFGTSSDPWPDRLMLVKTARRNHNATTGTGNSLSTSNSVASYVAHYYDSALRRTHTVDFGTNASADVFENGTAPAWPPSPLAAPSFTTSGRVVSGVEFGARGLVARSIDPKQHRTEYRYDDLSRRIAVIENAQGSTGSLSITWNSTNEVWDVTGLSSAADQNRVTSFVYDASSNIVKQIAHLSDSTEQVTKYTYSTDKGSPNTDTNSLIATRRSLLSKVNYPDESTGQPGTGSSYEVTYSYNQLGELRTTVDQNGTKHTYKRDAAGRVEWDTPTVGSNIDDTIKRIVVDYDPFGRLEWIKSYDNIGTGTEHVRNEVEFAYTKLWQVSKVYQDVNGEVGYGEDGVPTGDTRVVAYTYGDSAAPTSGSSAANYSRVTSMIYPNGNTIDYGYGISGGLDDRISRAFSVKDPADSDTLVEYSRVGLDLFAIVDYPLADVQLDRTFSRDGKRSLWSTQGVGLYPGWDRHGRVAIHAWMDGELDEGQNGFPTRPPIVDEGYTYDKASNRITKYDMRPGAQPATTKPDWQYTYDELDRLTEAKKGDRTATTFATGIGSQKWVLDVLGNWLTHKKELDGNVSPNPYEGTGETENRTHNQANEITNSYPNGTGQSPTLPFTYDAAGNLRDQHYNGSNQYWRFTHDAWNRMVRAEFAGSAVPDNPWILDNEYNGLHWRTIAKRPVPAEEPGGSIREMYYSAAWQLLEERIDDDYQTSPGLNRVAQEVWGLRYIDDAVMRTAAVGDEGGNERKFYHLTDVQFSTVAMIGLGGTYAPLYERVSYDPYGKATHHWAGDVDGDRDFDEDDRDAIKTASSPGYVIGDSGYDVRMDLDRDGDVDGDDKDIGYAMDSMAALGSGEISDRSATGPDNVFGFDGYVFSPELQRYCVRFRWYDPVSGRWMTRDILQYVDGMNIYEPAMSNPCGVLDPLGLTPQDKWYDVPPELRDNKDFRKFVECSKEGLELPKGFQYSRKELFDLAEEWASTNKVSKDVRRKVAQALRNMKGTAGGLGLVALSFFFLADNVAAAVTDKGAPCRSFLKAIKDNSDASTCSVSQLESKGELCKEDLVRLTSEAYGSAQGVDMGVAFDGFLQDVLEACRQHNIKPCKNQGAACPSK